VRPELADAVAIALALDPRERYSTAREMGRALSDGGKGIAPGERAASRSAPATQATSVLSGSRRGTPPARAVATRRPRPGPARAKPPLEAPARPAKQRARRGRGRLLGILLALFALALVVVAIVLLTTPAQTKVVLRNVVTKDVQQATAVLKQLVSENEK
jgi:hypothetical protein